MLESHDELIAEEIYRSNVTDITKHMVANGVQTACTTCRNIMLNPAAIGIPRSKLFDTACRFSFILNSILTKSIDENNFSQLTYDEVRTGHGRPIIHYMSGNVIFHLKKETSAHRLPQGARYRIEETKGNEQILLFPESVEAPPAHMVVTFNHREFQPIFIQIGMIDPTYERWLFRDNLMSYIQAETVETMQKTYGATLEQQAIERVQKNFRLEMKG